jgi:hypothetical protein
MRIPKKTTFLLLASLAVTVMTAVAALQSSTQGALPSGKQEEATPIQEGVMSEKQKKHSKLFKGFGNVTRGKKLRELAAERGRVEVIYELEDGQAPRSSDRQKYLNKYLQKVSCGADAVVIGSVLSKSSQIIEEGTFLFTDYELTVEEVLKDNSVAHIQPHGAITVTRSGGAVTLNGHAIRAKDYRSEPLAMGGRYLVFLRFLPDTGAYQSLDNSLFEDSFRLSEDQIIQVSEKPLPFGSRRTAIMSSFMVGLRAALNNPCDNH